MARSASPGADGVLRSSNTPDPSLTYRLLPSLVSSVTNRSSSPSSSKSPASTPMLASALPVTGSATPESSAAFSNVPSLLVQPQLVFFAVVGDVDVDPSVAIEVRRGHTKSGTELAGDSRRYARVGKCPVAAVDVQPILQRLIGCPACSSRARRRPRSTGCCPRASSGCSCQRTGRASRRD